MTEKNSDTQKRFKGLISLAMKAGRLEIGEARAQDAIRGGKAYLIIVAEDASDNTKKKFKDMAAFRKLPIILTSNRDELGRTVGRNFAVTMAVTDKGFAEGLKKLIDK